MLVLGIILILAALTAIGYLWFGTQGEPALEIDLGAFTAHLTPLQIFLLGAGCLVLLVLGGAMTMMGLRGRVKRRREVRDLREQVRSQERQGRTEDRDGRWGRDAADDARADDSSRAARERAAADDRVVEYEREVPSSSGDSVPPPPPAGTTGPAAGERRGDDAPGSGSGIDPSRFRP